MVPFAVPLDLSLCFAASLLSLSVLLRFIFVIALFSLQRLISHGVLERSVVEVLVSGQCETSPDQTTEQNPK